MPIKSTQERTSELRLQFPVSSGQLHRKSENEWVPVSPKKPPEPVPPPKVAETPAAPEPVPPVVPVAPSAPPGPQIFPQPIEVNILRLESVVCNIRVAGVSGYRFNCFSKTDCHKEAPRKSQ